MIKLRYFSATDGVITVFRASASRVYSSAWFTTEVSQGKPRPANGLGFSVSKHGNYPGGKYPAKEISKAEYDQLVAWKVNRLLAAGRYPGGASPQDSWVVNP
jgi:hypothetical protein